MVDDLLWIVQERRENPKSARPGSRWSNFDMSELPCHVMGRPMKQNTPIMWESGLTEEAW